MEAGGQEGRVRRDGSAHSLTDTGHSAWGSAASEGQRRAEGEVEALWGLESAPCPVDGGRGLWCIAYLTLSASRKICLVVGLQTGCGGRHVASNCYGPARADDGRQGWRRGRRTLFRQ